MRRYTSNIILLIIIVLGCSRNQSLIKPLEKVIKTITVEEAWSIIKNYSGNPDFIILDMRTEAEFRSGYVDGALNMDYFDGTFEDNLNSLDKKKTYLIYCANGNRSSMALEIMGELGFVSVYNADGDMSPYFKDVE